MLLIITIEPDTSGEEVEDFMNPTAKASKFIRDKYIPPEVSG